MMVVRGRDEAQQYHMEKLKVTTGRLFSQGYVDILQFAKRQYSVPPPNMLNEDEEASTTAKKLCSPVCCLLL